MQGSSFAGELGEYNQNIQMWVVNKMWYMHNPACRRTFGSLRITPPVPRTWIPVNRDMPQTPIAGTPATS